MSNQRFQTQIVTARTLVVAAIGAVLAWAANVPVFMLVGPALAVAAVSLWGMTCDISTELRYVAFLVIGIGIGSGVDPRATEAMLRWPVAFLSLGGVLVIVLLICPVLLRRGFGFGRDDSVLAASPGHLSFAIAMSVELKTDVTRVVVSQAVRILSLTVLVPYVALAMGVEIVGTGLREGPAMSGLHFAVLAALGMVMGEVLRRVRMPAPVLMGAMVVSSVAHATEIVPGVLPEAFGVAGFVAVGALIGSRFSGVTLAALRRSVTAGLAITVVMTAVSAAIALAVADRIGMDPSHVLVAFAPGAFETMIAMGAILGADPGFVAAAHVVRLLLLSAMVPFALGLTRRSCGS